MTHAIAFGRIKLPHKIAKGAKVMDHSNSNTGLSNHVRGTHLSIEDRVIIMMLRNENKSLRYIASILNCSPSTVGYELKRGTPTKNTSRGRNTKYIARRGQQVYQTNRTNCHRKSKVVIENPFVAWLISNFSTQEYSIDSLVGKAKTQALFNTEDILCTKTIYNAVWKGLITIKPSDLPEALMRKPKAKKSNKNLRVLGKSIEERPQIVSEKTEFGHWEVDTVVGKKAGKESVILTLLEKFTRNFLTVKINGKDADSVMEGMENLRSEYIENFPTVFKTITADNGSEFARLSELEDSGVSVYFAHPYSSWERGQNENKNKMLRRYITKGKSIEDYTPDQIIQFSYNINSVPRKILNYKTSEELFDRYLDEIYSIEQNKLVT